MEANNDVGGRVISPLGATWAQQLPHDVSRLPSAVLFQVFMMLGSQHQHVGLDPHSVCSVHFQLAKPTLKAGTRT